MTEIQISPVAPAPIPGKLHRRRNCGCGCLVPLLLTLVLLAVYFLAPIRTNILVLGIDAREPDGVLGRTDTIMLVTILPLKPYVGMLSIPRDLWVTIPGHGENRINTAHFFAEAANPGRGPAAATDTVALNFGLTLDYYLRTRFNGVKGVVDAMGGVDLVLDRPLSGYAAGRHHLNGDQALTLVRDRQGSDDFFRMERGQIFLKAVMRSLLNPTVWPRLPATAVALAQAIDTNLPIWLWPRLGLALLRAGPEGIDNRSISREMVQPFTTTGGAAVLAPDWAIINPVLLEMFGE